MSKDLKEKAIKFNGKDYVQVVNRVSYFNDTYKNGSIATELLLPVVDKRFIVKATITPNTNEPTRIFTGYSQAVAGEGYVNKASALENAETSAVGRALAMMGIGVIDSIASADEMHKAINSYQEPPREDTVTTTPLDSTGQEIPKSKPCPKHPNELMYFKNGQYGPFYSHKLADGTFCNTKLVA